MAFDNKVNEKTIRSFQENTLLSKIKTYGELLETEIPIDCPKQKLATRGKIYSIENVDGEDEHMIDATKGGRNIHLCLLIKP